jgi:hypothetical protein
METATKELFNYGGVGVLAVLAIGGLVTLWRHSNAHNKAALEALQRCSDVIGENSASNRELAKERTEANGALKVLAEQMARNNELQSKHQGAVLEMLAKSIR